MSGARSLDRFVVAVKAPEKAGALYERLGFQVMPQMRHIEIGTCNRVFQLHDAYVERGLLEAAGADHRVRAGRLSAGLSP
jgi:hypothetical protein